MRAEAAVQSAKSIRFLAEYGDCSRSYTTPFATFYGTHLPWSSQHFHLSDLTVLTYYQLYTCTLVSYLKFITMLLECLLLFPLACLCVIACLYVYCLFSLH